MAAFKFKVKTDNEGISNDDQFTLPLRPLYDYNIDIDWGDGSPVEPFVRVGAPYTNPTHTFLGGAGTYEISITENVVGGFPTLYNHYMSDTDRYKWIEITQWGDSQWSTWEQCWCRCINLTITATDESTAVTSSITSLNRAFQGCISLGNPPLWDLSSVTDMDYAFEMGYGEVGTPNEVITTLPLWDLSSVVSMRNTFIGLTSLNNPPLWDLSSVEIFTGTFMSCLLLTTVPLWDLSSATSLSSAFSGCILLNNLPLWNLSSVTTIGGTFSGCSLLNNLPLWNLSSLESMNWAFTYCTSLTTVPLWDLSSVTSMINTFAYCDLLNNLPLWDLSSVIDMGDDEGNGTFKDCLSLTTVPLWDLSSVIYFCGTFRGCVLLNNLPLWDLSSVDKANWTFMNCTSLTTAPLWNLSSATQMWIFVTLTLPPDVYSAFIVNLSNVNLNAGVLFHGGNSKYYQSAVASRAILTSDRSWIIYDGGLIPYPNETEHWDGSYKVSRTTRSFSLGLKASQGISFSENDGDDFIMPEVGVSPVMVWDEYNMAHMIALDNNDGLFYDIMTREGPEGSGLEKVWSDKVATDGSGGTAIAPKVKLGEDTGNYEFYWLRLALFRLFVHAAEDHFKGASGYNSEGIPDALQITVRAYIDGKLTAERTTVDIPITGDVHFDEMVEGHRLAIETEANMGEHAIVGRYLKYILTDKPIGDGVMTEDDYQYEFSTPKMWFSRTPFGIDRATGLTLDSDETDKITKITGPDGRSESAWEFTEAINLPSVAISHGTIMFFAQNVSATLGGSQIVPTAYATAIGSWNLYYAYVTGTGTIVVTPTGTGRLFDIKCLDGVEASTAAIAYYFNNINDHGGDVVLP